MQHPDKARLVLVLSKADIATIEGAESSRSLLEIQIESVRYELDALEAESNRLTGIINKIVRNASFT